MNVFNIAICDDEIEYVLQIEKYIDTHTPRK